MTRLGPSNGRPTIGRSGRTAVPLLRPIALAATSFVLLAAGVGGASAQGASVEAKQPREFRIADSFCFLPCMNATKGSAKTHESDIVTISRAELSGPMIKPCEGRVAVAVREGSQEDVLEDLHRRYGDEALTSAAQIVLPNGQFKMGAATCTPNGGTPSTFARLLSIEPERVTLLTDSGVVYELVPAKR